MHLIEQLINFILHFNVHLADFIHLYGTWAYVILFAIVFCETGLVVTPFLPGDTLLFAAGSLAVGGLLDIKWILITLSIAAIAGDSTNYWIGRTFGHWLIKQGDRWFFKKAYLDKTHEFYEKYGPTTVVLARFIPIVRTFAPFVAGLSKMVYLRFLFFSVSGSLLWISSVTLCGYAFGHIPFVKNNFTVLVLGIVFVSILPIIIQYIRVKFFRKTKAT